MTTVHCPQSLKEKELSQVKKNPENFIEINMISLNQVVDNFYIKNTHTRFKYRKKDYKIDQKHIYLLPTKSGSLILTSFYLEDNTNPQSFEQKNRGITCKALTLLYNPNLYALLVDFDEKKYNMIIAIFSVVLLIVNCIGLYLTFGGGF